MGIRIDEHAAATGGRLAAIRLSQFVLRYMDLLRAHVDDVDEAMILTAVVAITADRLTRTDLDPSLRDLKQNLPPEEIGHCNVSSLAKATGLNRETARRKIDRLVEKGFLTRHADGSITFSEGLIQEQRTRDLVRDQLEAARRLADELLRDGVLKLS